MDKKRILIVEDEEILQMLIAETLRLEGYHTNQAKDGQEGYDKIVNGSFDLIILDYMMPNMTGIGVLEKLKPLALAVPIIMLTAKANPADRELANKHGASHFMAKPFSPTELAKLVQSILR